MTELLLSCDVARELGLTSAAIRAAASKGQIQTTARTVGGVRLFDRAAVSAFKKHRDERRSEGREGAASMGPTAKGVTSPWMTAADAGLYLHRSKRFVLRQVRLGRLRAARVNDRGEILTRREWCDQLIEDQAVPVLLSARRRA